MEIVSCPKCGRPRASGGRCPSCGDAATPVDAQSPAPDEAGYWQGAAGAAETREMPTRQGLAAPVQRASRGKGGRGLVVGVIAAVVLIGAIVAVVAVLTAGGAAVVKEEASVASAPKNAYDQAAKSLLQNAMTAMDATFTESADYTTITQPTLTAMEPAIAWMPGSAGVSVSPPAGAKAQQSAVSWACTGRMTYELGTWSASGVEFGVRVDKLAGGNTYYMDGSVASW